MTSFPSFLIFLVFFTSCSTNSRYMGLQNDLIVEYANDMKYKYEVEAVGTGGGGPTNVKTISVEFWAFYEVGQQQARTIFVDCIESLLRKMNSNKKIRPYLNDFPSTFKNTDVTLAFYSNRNLVRPSNNKIALVYLAKDGMVYYDTYDYSIDDFVTLYSESYEEALSKVCNN